MRRLLLLFFGVITTVLSSAQVTTEGRDFWLGFMENEFFQDLALEIYISSSETAQVEIEAPLDAFNASVTVNPGLTELVVVPLTLMPTQEGITNFGIHITSDVDVSVYALNKRSFSADAAVILPTKALGKEYYVMAHVEPPGDAAQNARESSMLIVATEDNTTVEVTPSVTTFGGLQAGQTATITLNAGQTFEIKSGEDLTGTHVKTVAGSSGSCERVAVFGGNKWTNVGGCGDARDHLLEQMFPVSTWGENFLYVPYQTRVGGDYVKIVASEDDTEVNIQNEAVIELNAGEYHIIKALDGVRTVSANKPISFGQFSRSQACDGVQAADPFMILASPLEQRIANATFSAFNVQVISNYYLTLITTLDGISTVELDGVNISSEFTIVGDLAYANLGISQGNHTVTAPEGVIAYVYGYGNFESFGYSAGVSLENLNLQIEGNDEDIGVIITQACVGSVVDFDAEFDVPAGEVPRFNTFEWNFGDGNNANGQQVQHTYSAPGEYEVTLVASDGGDACSSNSETITRIIQVEDIVVDELVGPLSVCPDVVGVEYTAMGPAGNTYQWLIDGGTIVSGANTDKISVDWGAARNDAYLKLIPTNAIGCIGDTLTYDVIINKRLEPAPPQSNGFTNEEVCFLEKDNVTYFTPATNGSDYEWFVDASGEIIGANDGNEIQVRWNNPGTGRVWYREFNPSISDCEGFSDTLTVTIYNEMVSTPTITNVLCNGEANGTITLAIAGGKPGDYQVNWDNGMTGAAIAGLIAGDYEATIIDVLGCEIVETYTITEPEVLAIAPDPVLMNVRCFQEANGSAMINVTGGTAPYSYRWAGGNNFSQTTLVPEINSLRAGSYQVTVTDANGCQTSINFGIAEPPLLEADLESLINNPICPQATDGTAFIDAKGGTPDYQFYWSNRPSVDDQNASDLSQGTYTVRIVDANGCETSLDVEVTERFPKIFIPNAFSPNTDGTNDEFKPVADCEFRFSMQIYNQWGSVVFTSENITEGWDGNFQGLPAPAGAYSYMIFYAGAVNEITFEETYRGTFKLVR